MKKKLCLMMVLLLLFPLTLTGCWDLNEPEQMVYANGLGVDFKDGVYTVYSQLFDLGTSGKSDQARPSSPHGEIIWGEGRDVDEAVFNVYKSSDRKIFWGHLSFVIMTESAIKHGGQQELVDMLDRFVEIRYHLWFYVSHAPIRDLLVASNYPSSLDNPKTIFEQGSFVKPVTMREVIIKLDEPGHEAIIPTVSITPNRIEEKEEVTSGIRLHGVTIITNHGYKGFLTEDEGVGLRWLTNKTKRGQISIHKDGKPAASIIVQKLDTDIVPSVKGNQVQFDIKIKGTAVVSALYQKVDLDFLNKEIANKVEEEVMLTYKESMKFDTDIYRLSEKLYRSDVKSWKKIAQNGKLPLTKDSIHSMEAKIDLHYTNQLHLIPSLE
ncbi:Ger(x)C family germination protein [Croceifilum oryzae]|uniref:Ger(X)C family germination protein n=1 Tax=Croceifilum oryzae TaxID=1553429 RepID=A0AAJ1TE50_9BACL|nr:Ger(x)C family spore germination protein [Croceifilum oryzae]MDQ0417245.1 Ger(x)C family germination protein [Croceifilum oryzae]